LYRFTLRRPLLRILKSPMLRGKKEASLWLTPKQNPAKAGYA
jgi:hypothetical protein